jgi:hypothetical protein
LCSDDVALNRHDTEIYGLLKEHMTNTVKWSAYNWIRPSLWNAMFQHSHNPAAKPAAGQKKTA